MATFAYLRVSTTDQTTEQQLKQILDAGYAVESDRVYVELGVSGKVPALQREQFRRLHDRLSKQDRIIVSKLDRLGRDTLDVISTIEKLTEMGVSVVVLGLGVLDQSPQSRLTLTMLAAISQFERELISERTKAKLAQLKAEGVKLGRPVKIDDAALKVRAEVLFGQGLSWRKVASELGVALSTLQRLMKSPVSAAVAGER
jgi:putative DNA-invertase from lambdoid prophage Rac